jgi:hypothetical protein
MPFLQGFSNVDERDIALVKVFASPSHTNFLPAHNGLISCDTSRQTDEVNVIASLAIGKGSHKGAGKSIIGTSKTLMFLTEAQQTLHE